MKRTSDKFFNLTRLRRATLLALFALASLQLTLAGHQFDQSAGTAVETCNVCVQADRLDDSIAVDSSLTVVRAENHVESPKRVATFVSSTAFRNFNSRAPPKL